MGVDNIELDIDMRITDCAAIVVEYAIFATLWPLLQFDSLKPNAFLLLAHAYTGCTKSCQIFWCRLLNIPKA